MRKVWAYTWELSKIPHLSIFLQLSRFDFGIGLIFDYGFYINLGIITVDIVWQDCFLERNWNDENRQ